MALQVSYPSWFSRSIQKGSKKAKGSKQIMYTDMVVHGNKHDNFERIKFADSILGDVVNYDTNKKNIIEYFTKGVICSIDQELTHLMINIRSLTQFPSFEQSELDNLKGMIETKLESLEKFIQLYSLKPCKAIVTDESFDDMIESVELFNNSVKSIVASCPTSLLVVSARNIYQFIEFTSRLSSVIDYVESETENVIDSLNDEIKNIEGKGENMTRNDDRNAENIRKTVQKLNLFKNTKLFENEEQFKILEKRNEDLVNYLGNIKKIIANILATFQLSIDENCFDKKMYMKNITNMFDERRKMQENFSDVFKL